MSRVNINALQRQAELVGSDVDPALTIVLRMQGDELVLDVARAGEGPHPRVLSTVHYLLGLYPLLGDEDESFPAGGIIFQASDVPADVLSVSWERQEHFQGVRLIPDVDYFDARGYEAVMPEVPDWSGRQDRLHWRGLTTGGERLNLDNLEELPRYRLVSQASCLGPSVDVGFVDVVQADPGEARALRARLEAELLMRPSVPTAEQALFRYIVDIDGNSNTWGLVERLRLGCCILKVDGTWNQWIYDRLEPWVHYVPVAADLGDLEERWDWCRSHSDRSVEIAAAGRRLALETRFYDEMRSAARTAFGPGDRVLASEPDH